MKNIVSFIFIIVSFKAFSQINSPNGSNIFSYNGLADVTFRFTDRGSGGRAFVHADYNVLALNFENDFTGGKGILLLLLEILALVPLILWQNLK